MLKANKIAAIVGLSAALSAFGVAGWGQSSEASAPPTGGSQKIMQLQANWRADMSVRDYKAASRAHRAAERIREAMASGTSSVIYAHRTGMAMPRMTSPATGAVAPLLQKEKRNQQIIQRRSESVNPAGAGPVGDQGKG